VAEGLPGTKEGDGIVHFVFIKKKIQNKFIELVKPHFHSTMLYKLV
jgi:hypothetical protein